MLSPCNYQGKNNVSQEREALKDSRFTEPRSKRIRIGLSSKGGGYDVLASNNRFPLVGVEPSGITNRALDVSKLKKRECNEQVALGRWIHWIKWI